ncbi:MAG: tetratricopeptide repeat protein [Nitrospiraceae bacterium]|nr:tetratricopeptide repeat protein [Nitrospiraceae bacterium]
MREREAERYFNEGLDALRLGNCLAALAFFEKAVSLADKPLYRSYVAYGIAKERGQAHRAEQICREAITCDPGNSFLYLNLGRVLLVAGRKPEAIEIFRKGLRCGGNAGIVQELNRLGTRKPPIFPFLKRDHPLNKYLGMILRRMRPR